jgi:hypothetical protein
MLAASPDNLIFLLLIAVAALFQLFSKAISKSGKKSSDETSNPPTPQTPRPVQRASRESDADRIRKFLEALGQPPSSTPPPPLVPRTNVPPRPLAPVQPPPVLTPAWGFPREKQRKRDITPAENRPAEPPKRFQENISLPVPVSVAAPFEVHEAFPVDIQAPPAPLGPVEVYTAGMQTEPKRTDLRIDIVTLLASKSTLRGAILLREILGTPRGLQTLDVTP